jgi:hypothetical protein
MAPHATPGDIIGEPRKLDKDVALDGSERRRG